MADVDTIIGEQITNANLYANGAINALQAAMSHLASYSPVGNSTQINVKPPTYNIENAPGYAGGRYTPGTAPASGVLRDVDGLSFPEPPANNIGQAPAISLPPLPTSAGTFNQALPNIDAIQFPAPIDFSTLLARPPADVVVDLPDRPSVNVPAFSATRPTNFPTAPTDLGVQLRQAYDDISPVVLNRMQSAADAFLVRMFPQHVAGLQALETRLATYLAGGTGIDDEIAEQFTELTRDQTSAEYVRTARAATLETGKRGFTRPQGATDAAIRRARTAAADANSRNAADLRKTRFELEQKNLQFAVDQGRQLRTFAVDAYTRYFGELTQLNGQSLDYAKALVQALVEVFNTAVRRAELDIEAYRTEAQVYEYRLRAALAVIDIYKAELEGERLKVEVNVEQVRVYEAKIRTAEVYAELQKVQVETVSIRANLEKLKIDIFDAQVRAYAAQVQAKRSEYDAYIAAVQGQAELVRAFEAQARAYAAEVEGYNATIHALEAKSRAQLGFNESVTRQYEASTRAFASIEESKVRGMNLDVEAYRAQLLGVSTQNQALAEKAKVDQRNYELAQTLAIKDKELSIQQAFHQATVAVQNMQAVAQIAGEIGRVLAGVAQATLSGINALAVQSQSS